MAEVKFMLLLLTWSWLARWEVSGSEILIQVCFVIDTICH